MAVLRFPNPGSDFQKMVETFRVIYRALVHGPAFDLDDAVRALIDARQVSSQGAVGEEALRRSTREDRSRDPLYNQLKMYSEIYRMLGWIHPAGKKLLFRFTPLADYVCHSPMMPLDSPARQLVAESLLGICFPNPNTDNKGVHNSRPFPFLLRLMQVLDGRITRHEMILGLLGTVDDLAPTALEDAATRILNVRGNRKALLQAVTAVAPEIQVNTLENYTRFPIGAVQAPMTAWATTEALKGIYERPTVFLELTAAGRNVVEELAVRADVREENLAPFSLDERAHFAYVAAYAKVERAGFDISPIVKAIEEAEEIASEIFSSCAIATRGQLLYSPFQQADHDVLRKALELSTTLEERA